MEEDNSNQILRYLFRPRLPMIPLLAGTVLAVWQNITMVGLLNFAIYIKLSFVIAAIIVMGGLEKDGKCGWPRKLDNLTWCKIPVN